MNTEKLFLGVSREIITPKIGCNLYGYDPNLYSTSVNDDLTATAYYFKQNNTQALILNTTLCSINNAITNTLLKEISIATGIPAENVLIHSTHTHSGPNVSGNSGWGDVDTNYVSEILIPNLVKVCIGAKLNPTPVKMGVASGKSLVGINRRQLNEQGKIKLGQNPEGAFDPDMTVISFANENKQTLGNFIHYGCHGTASGLNTEISRDWSGPMVDAIENISGGLTSFFNGPEGDIGPRLKNGKTTGDRSVKYALELGEIASKDASCIYKNIVDYTVPKLSVKKYIVKLPYDKRIPLEDAIEGYKQYENKTENIYVAKRTYYENVIKSYSDNYVETDGEYFEQTIIALGDVAFVSFPYELFADIGIKIKNAKVYEKTLVLALCNGSKGYFPARQDVPFGGYEVNSFKIKTIQPISDNADEYAIVQTVENLKNLKCKE
ncbi:MAG: neutral/alkaline non-lysosomal ceramidase N-terminal domain-containing protein [Clostridia bacterium]|nr:neutral/alkaline non-lysosomal ceramidase N-terminal domain-containing protein [Clostridia bacterium]